MGDDKTTVFIGKLDYGATEDDVREVFCKYGEVTRVSMPTDKMTGKPRGFAFVSYGSSKDAQDAVDGTQRVEINGREIAVSISRPREGGGGGGGRSYGGGGGYNSGGGGRQYGGSSGGGRSYGGSSGGSYGDGGRSYGGGSGGGGRSYGGRGGGGGGYGSGGGGGYGGGGGGGRGRFGDY